jgi:hypothetical protein
MSADSRIIRKALQLGFTDSEFVGLCQDEFPTTAREFTANMDRSTRINLLLEREGGEQILAILTGYYAAAIRKKVPDFLPADASGADFAPVPGAQDVKLPVAPPTPAGHFVKRRDLMEEALRLLREHSIVHLYGPPKVGKTDLLLRLIKHLQKMRNIVLYIDINPLYASYPTEPDQFLLSVARQIYLSFNFSPERLNAKLNRPAIPIDSFQVVRDALLVELEKACMRRSFRDARPTFVIALDHIEKNPRQGGIESEHNLLLSLMRAIANELNIHPRPYKLKFLTCVSTAPALLVNSQYISAHNIGTTVLIENFSEQECLELATKHRLVLSKAELAAIRQSLGFHPMLVHQLFAHYTGALRSTPLIDVLQQELGKPRGGIFWMVLDFLQSAADPALLDALGRVARDPQVRLKPPMLAHRLFRLGLISNDRPPYDLVGELYRHLCP